MPCKRPSSSAAGTGTMVPNKAYSGSPKPKLAALKFVPFTADSTEFTALKTGQVDVGYVPSQDLPPRPGNSVLPPSTPRGGGSGRPPSTPFARTTTRPNPNTPRAVLTRRPPRPPTTCR